MTINVLIVDDEPLAREGVALLLSQEKDISIVGECANGSEAIRDILSLKPDLVFLDIKMPKISGFDVVNAVGVENMPLVIFLTAYDEYAIEAFNTHAIDYLLKPLEGTRFKSSLNRARKQLLKNKISQLSEQLTSLLTQNQKVDTPNAPIKADDSNERIVIRASRHVYILEPNDIYWIEAEGDYVSVHTVKKSHLVRDTMRSMESRLSPLGFQRVHRSCIVNLTYVRELVSLDSGDYQIVLDNNTRIKWSRHYKDVLYQRLNASP